MTDLAQRDARIVAAYQAGASQDAIARAEGIGRGVIQRVLRSAGVHGRHSGPPPSVDRELATTMRRQGASWEEIAAVVGGSANSLRKASTRWKRAAAPVPAWVPAHLVNEYRRIAAREGEHQAASDVRVLKRSVRAA